MMADIGHPLAYLQWERVSLSRSGGRRYQPDFGCAVLLGDKIYVGGEVDKLFALTLDTPNSTLWTALTTPTSHYALATYQSRLVIVGGMEISNLKVTNKLWMSDEGVDWEPSLPPMPTKRASSSAINTGSPQYLIVAGGQVRMDSVPVDTVEILQEGQWTTIESLPVPCQGMKSTLHNGNLYLLGQSWMFCCQLKALVASSVVDTRADRSNWVPVPISQAQVTPFVYESCVPFAPAFASIGHQLITFAYAITYGYSLKYKCWIHAGHMEQYSWNKSAVVLPKGEVMILADDPGYDKSGDLVKASVRVAPFDADSQFTLSALYRLELAGIPVVTALKKNVTQLITDTGIRLNNFERKQFASNSYSPERGLEVVMTIWKRQLPTTWRSLLDILKKQGLDQLREEIEAYLTDFTSLKKRCLSVIMSTLLPQWSLTPEQLDAKLPSYVPTMTKKAIVDCFKEHTCLLIPSSIEPPPRKKAKVTNEL